MTRASRRTNRHGVADTIGIVAVRFLAGALPGAICGFFIWALWLGGETTTGLLVCVIGMACLLGTLSALLGKSFWEFLGEHLDLFLPW